MNPGMPPEPGFHARVLVGPVVVHDEMQAEFGRSFEIDLLEETEKLLMPMTRHAVADHFAVEHAEGRKQGGRAVAFVVVRHRPTAAFLQRQARLGAIEGLDLTFLVDAQHQRFVRGIEIKPDDVVEFFDKVFVAAELEGLDEMGLEVVLLPDTTDRGLAEALGLGHAARAPMGRIRWCRMQSGFDDGTDFFPGNTRHTTRTWSVLLQTLQPQRQETFPPELHRGPGDSQLSCDVLTEHTVGRQLDNLCPLHQSQREASPMRPRGQNRPLFGRQKDRGCSSHAS